jgi:prevent-host-death family protein
MKSISIRELHARTGKWVRQVADHGQVVITDNGQAVARMVPEVKESKAPYFSQRRFINRKMKLWIESGKLGRGGTDATAGISEDREDRA